MTDAAEIDLSAPNPFLNPGVHLWKVTKAERGVSKTGGNDQIKVEFCRDDSPMQKMADYLTLSATAYDSTKQKLLAFFPQGYRGSLADLAFQLVGTKVYAQTEISEFKGSSSLRPTRGALSHNGYAPFIEGGAAPAGYVAPVDDTPF